MRRDVALLVALALAGATAISTGAAPLTAADDVSDEIHLSPASDYAYLDDEGELVVDASSSNPALDADGVNADGLTDLGDVFHVTYTGSERARVWVTADGETVTFLAEGRPVQSRANGVVLGSNESATVGLAVDNRESDDLIDGFEVHATVADSERVDATTGSGDAGSAGYDDGDGRSVRIERPAPDRRSVVATYVSAGEAVAVGFDGLVLDETDRGALTLDELRVRRADPGPLDFDVEAGVSVPSDAALDEGTVLGAVRVAPTLGADSVDAAVFRFGIDDRYLDGVGSGTLVVYRFSGGESTRLTTEELDGDDGRTVSVESSGFSTFVVAVEPDEADRATEGTPTRADEDWVAADDADAAADVTDTDSGTVADAERSTADADRERSAARSTPSGGLDSRLDAAPTDRLATAAGFVLGVALLGRRVVGGS